MFNIESCLNEINHWMMVNRLKLNKDKTELLVISAKHLPGPLLEFSGAFFLAEIFEKVSFDPYNFRIIRLSARESEQMENF